jgi:hypothetical protein
VTAATLSAPTQVNIDPSIDAQERLRAELGPIERQLQLRRFGKLGRGTGDDFAACLGMNREHAVVAQ